MQNSPTAFLLACAAALLGGCAPAPQPDPSPPPPPGWHAPPPPGTAGYEGPRPSDPIRPVPGQAELQPPSPLPAFTDDPDIAFRNRAARMLRGLPGWILFVAAEPPQRAWRDNTDRLIDWKTFDGAAQGLDRPAADHDAQAALAGKLIEQGVTYVLVDRRLAPWHGALDDRENRVLEQLCRGRSLDWFHPLLIGKTYRLFQVASPFAIDATQARRLTTALRTWLAGRAPRLPLEAELPATVVGRNGYEVGLALYGSAESELRGRLILRLRERGATLSAALEQAAAQIRDGWAELRSSLSKPSEIALPTELEAALPRLKIELTLAFDHVEILDRDPLVLPTLVEPGLDGLFLRGEVADRETEASVFPGHAVDHGIQSPRRLVDALGTDLFSFPAGAWRRPAYDFGRFSTRVFLERRPGGELIETERGWPRLDLDAVTPQRLRAARQQAHAFLIRVQDAEGRFLQRYQPMADRWYEGNDLHAHALITLALLHADTVESDDTSSEGFRRALGQLLAPLRCEAWQGQRTCFPWHTDPTERVGKASAGAAALTALVLIRLAERQPPLGRQLEETLSSLGRHLLRMQDLNGHFRQFHVLPVHPYYGCERMEAPGQILLALARLHEHSGEAIYREAFDRALVYYGAYWDQLVHRAAAEGARDPRLVRDWLSFVPWQVIALAEMHRQTGDARYADRAIAMQSATDARFLITQARAPRPDLAGGVHRAPLEPPTLDDAMLAASRAAAIAAAIRDHREYILLRRRLEQGLRFLLQAQIADRATSVHQLPRPWMIEGAFRSSTVNPLMRVEHTAAALLALAAALTSLALTDVSVVGKNPE